MNHQDLYKLLATVQKNVRCPQCGKSYDFSLIQIRGIVDSLVFLELSCSSHMPLLATVSLAKQAQKNVLTKQEINSNDVIDTYKFLKNFDGSFEKLFNDIKTNNK
jgi:hypothetical protein